MALSRAFLKGLGLTEEQISAIIEGHTESVEALKAKADESAKALEAEKAKDWEAKYSALNKSFDDYKAGVTADRVRAQKVSAYTDALRKAGVQDKRIASVLKVDSGKIDALELDDTGKLKNPEATAKAIAADWADFIAVSGSAPAAQPATPPAAAPTAYTADMLRSMSAEEINKHWDDIKKSL